MAVPANVRTQFDTSVINTGMNAKEETTKHEAYADHEIYIPDADPRELNVVEKIKEGTPHPIIRDDSVKYNDLDKKLAQIDAAIAGISEDVEDLKTPAEDPAP